MGAVITCDGVLYKKQAELYSIHFYITHIKIFTISFQEQNGFLNALYGHSVF